MNWQPGTHYEESNGDNVVTLQGFEVIFANIIGLALRAAVLVSFIMIIIGGFKYLTSGGDPKAAASARLTLTWGIIGIVIIIGAWFILRLISYFTGIDVTIFKISG